MKINSELRHVLNPKRTKLQWGVFYVVLIVVLLTSLYAVANHIKTHTLATGKIQLSTSYSQYVVGETIKFSITNQYNAPIFITNKCPGEPLAVYRQANGKWVRLHATATAKDCPDEDRQVSVPASSTVTTSLAPWHQLFDQPGKYRLVALVNNYDALPYVDFTVVTAPVASQPTPAPISVTGGQHIQVTAPSGSADENESQTTTTSPQSVKPAAKTVTLTVNSSGNYSQTSIVLKAGDSIQFVYSKPYNDEVRTHFTARAPTVAALSSVTLDSEVTTRTVTYNTTGSWNYKADDHSGDTGTLTVQ